MTSFVTGGWVSKHAKPGTTRLDGLIAVADWYATFCELVSINATDPQSAAASLPAIDSISMLSYIKGERATSPRTELQPDSNVLLRVDPTNASRLWKLFGTDFPGTPQGSTGWACFPGPQYPNATDPSCHSGGGCDKELGGCLFELRSDPTEHVDLAASASHAEVLRGLVGRLGELQASLFNPDRGAKDPRACDVARSRYGGFYGPWLPDG